MLARLRCIIGTLLALASPAAANEDFTIYTWIATSLEMRDKYGEQLHQLIDFEDSPMDRHGAIVLSAGHVGLYPYAGIHIAEADPNYMAKHFDRMKHDMRRWVPSGYDGIVCIDYESWWAAWDHTQNVPSTGGPGDRDKDYKDDWEDFIAQHRPEIIAGKTGAERELALRDSYEEATMRFLIATLRYCRQLYPDARWGYYDYPKMLYKHALTPPGTIGYGDLTTYASEVNDRLAPLWAEMDITIPRIYPSRQAVLVVEDIWRDNTPVQQYQFLSSMVLEAKRVAPDKPCIPIGSTRYFGATDKTIDNHSLNERNTWMQFAVPRDAGAEGVLLWGDAITEHYAQMTATYMNDIAIPVANELWKTWYPAGAASTAVPNLSGVRTYTRSTAGGETATPAPIPTDVRMRKTQPGQRTIWAPVWQGATRVSMPGHTQPPATGPIHRGGRIVSWRASGGGDGPPQHQPALTADPESDGDSGEEAGGDGPQGGGAESQGEQG